MNIHDGRAAVARSSKAKSRLESAWGRVLPLAADFLLWQAVAFTAQEDRGSRLGARMSIDDPPSALSRAVGTAEAEEAREGVESRPVYSLAPAESCLEALESQDWMVGGLIGILRARGSDKASYFGGIHARSSWSISWRQKSPVRVIGPFTSRGPSSPASIRCR